MHIAENVVRSTKIRSHPRHRKGLTHGLILNTFMKLEFIIFFF